MCGSNSWTRKRAHFKVGFTDWFFIEEELAGYPIILLGNPVGDDCAGAQRSSPDSHR
jgi:hypothetical protein